MKDMFSQMPAIQQIIFVFWGICFTMFVVFYTMSWITLSKERGWFKKKSKPSSF